MHDAMVVLLMRERDEGVRSSEVDGDLLCPLIQRRWLVLETPCSKISSSVSYTSLFLLGLTHSRGQGESGANVRLRRL
jgi:hypothetical protein